MIFRSLNCFLIKLALLSFVVNEVGMITTKPPFLMPAFSTISLMVFSKLALLPIKKTLLVTYSFLVLLNDCCVLSVLHAEIVAIKIVNTIILTAIFGLNETNI